MQFDVSPLEFPVAPDKAGINNSNLDSAAGPYGFGRGPFLRCNPGIGGGRADCTQCPIRAFPILQPTAVFRMILKSPSQGPEQAGCSDRRCHHHRRRRRGTAPLPSKPP